MRGLVPAVVLVLALAGCGDGGGGDPNPDRFDLTTPRQEPVPEGGGSGGEDESRRAPRRQVAVIRGWADALRRGDVARANAYFRIPSRVSNGGAPGGRPGPGAAGGLPR